MRCDAQSKGGGDDSQSMTCVTAELVGGCGWRRLLYDRLFPVGCFYSSAPLLNRLDAAADKICIEFHFIFQGEKKKKL